MIVPFGEADYYQQIEVILLALARLYEQNEQRPDSPASDAASSAKAGGQ